MQQKNVNWQDEYVKKVIKPEYLQRFAEKLHTEKKSIATINGSFDLMHAGHLYILFEAAKVADLLIVCLNSDSSIQKYKAQDRPIIPLKYRIEMMAAIGFVDFVTWFDETDPRDILQKIRPNVHVNGAEYGHNCIEKPLLDQIGARLHLVDRIDGLATSEIIEKIRTCDSLVR